MPSTRSQTTLALGQPSSSKVTLDEQPDSASDSNRNESGSESDQSITESFTTISRTVSKLRRKVLSLEKTNRKLRRSNDTLTSQLNASREAGPRTRKLSTQSQNGTSVNDGTTLENEVPALKRRVRTRDRENEKLRKEVVKYKSKIKKLERKEVDEEVDELINGAEVGVDDTEPVLRKLLRDLSSLVSVGVLSDDGPDDCCVCWEAMKVGESTCFPCQHILCDSCTQNLRETTVNELSCPTCRGLCEREDLEHVQHTATSQWDAILEIAKTFSRMDVKHGPMDTSDEEHEEHLRENFINDGSTSQGEDPTLSDDGEHDENMDTEEHGVVDSDDEPLESPLYSQASPSVKKRRLNRLVLERSKKSRQ